MIDFYCFCCLAFDLVSNLFFNTIYLTQCDFNVQKYANWLVDGYLLACEMSCKKLFNYKSNVKGFKKVKT